MFTHVLQILLVYSLWNTTTHNLPDTNANKERRMMRELSLGLRMARIQSSLHLSQHPNTTQPTSSTRMLRRETYIGETQWLRCLGFLFNHRWSLSPKPGMCSLRTSTWCKQNELTHTWTVSGPSPLAWYYPQAIPASTCSPTKLPTTKCFVTKKTSHSSKKWIVMSLFNHSWSVGVNHCCVIRSRENGGDSFTSGRCRLSTWGWLVPK